jgi:hypothetical protein
MNACQARSTGSGGESGFSERAARSRNTSISANQRSAVAVSRPSSWAIREMTALL